MQRTLSLRGACAGDIPACLQDLAQLALTRQGPTRPAGGPLAVVKVEPHMLPLGVNPPPTVSIWGIYSQMPLLDDPTGDRLLGATVELCPGGCAADCCGSRDLTLHLTQTGGFPLSAAEVNWYIYKRFGMEREAEVCIPKAFLFLYQLCDHWNIEREANNEQSDVPGNKPAISAAPVLPLKAGRKRAVSARLKTTVWLESEIRKLENIHDYGHLYNQWLQMYFAEYGHYPRDPDRAFTQAAEGCIRRILKHKDAA
jgi:hypothetical protein